MARRWAGNTRSPWCQ